MSLLDKNSKQVEQITKRIWESSVANYTQNCKNYNLAVITVKVNAITAPVFSSFHGRKYSGQTSSSISVLNATTGLFISSFSFTATGTFKFIVDVSQLYEFIHLVDAPTGTFTVEASLMMTDKTSLPSGTFAAGDVSIINTPAVTVGNVVSVAENIISDTILKTSGTITSTEYNVSKLSRAKFRCVATEIDPVGRFELVLSGKKIGDSSFSNVPFYSADGTFVSPYFMANGTAGVNIDVLFYANIEDYDVIKFNTYKATGSVSTVQTNLYIKITNEEMPDFSLTFFTDVLTRDKFNLKKWVSRPLVYDIFRNMFVFVSNSNLCINTSNNLNTSKPNYTIAINSINFPGLLNGSKITHVYILPYTRKESTPQHGTDLRICVFTDKRQIYHNYPSRAPIAGNPNGNSLNGDIALFEESVIWDTPIENTSRRLPKKVNSDLSIVERFDPSLPDSAYTFSPVLNTDAGFVDTYSNGGFPLFKVLGGKTYPRFYLFEKGLTAASSDLNPLTGLSYPVKTVKLSYFGKYQIDGARNCVFATSDGGRNFYVKYEFAKDEAADQRYFGNPINTTGLTYTSNSFAIQKRTLTVPTELVKEPSTLFTYSESKPIVSMTQANPAVLNVATHGLTTGNVIRIVDNGGVSHELDFMKNDSATETSGGTGVFYCVKVLDSNNFQLHEYIHSPDSNIPCRHIHALNNHRDGLLVNTGEVYPNGWAIFLKQPYTDLYSWVDASNILSSVRLNSTPNSANRNTGMILIEEADGLKYLHASDDVTRTRNAEVLPTGRTETLTRNSAGIFKGLVSEIDTFQNSKPVCEFDDVAIYFIENQGMLILGGMAGQYAVSFDFGKTWEKFKLDVLHYPNGILEDGNIYIGDYLITRK